VILSCDVARLYGGYETMRSAGDAAEWRASCGRRRDAAVVSVKWTPTSCSGPQPRTPEERSDERRHSNSWQQVARLAPGRTLEQAQSQIDAVNKANFDRFPQLQAVITNVGFHTVTRSFQAELVEGSQRTLYLLWGGVLCVLIIGCVNIANLVSIRASSRVRELATRHALGASIERLSRQILTETLLVAIVGVRWGWSGWWALSAATVLGLDRLPRGARSP
jgi:predicted lysophospholipase L1 biosynthesis ABC-type transport system permease subunit